MIEFVDTGGREYSCKIVRVSLDKTYTVREFCSTILSERSPNEWGEFIVDSPRSTYIRKYDRGEALESPRQYFPRKILDKVIESITARHNEEFNHIEYHIKIKEINE